MIKYRLFVFVPYVIFIGALFSACEAPRTVVAKWIAPKGDIPSTVTQSGPAEQPARADVIQSNITVPVPASTPVTVDREGLVSFTSPTATTVTAKGQSAHYEAPKSYGPPTPSEVAQGQAVKWFYAASLGLALAAGLAAYSGHYLAAIKFGFAAIALPVLTHFFSEHVGIGVALAAVGMGVAFILAWKTLNAKYDLEGKAAAVAAAPIVVRTTGYVEADGKSLVADAKLALAKLEARL